MTIVAFTLPVPDDITALDFTGMPMQAGGSIPKGK